ncbi:MAG: ATP-binding protein, partial [Syntrophomonadaceae bacterium]|nr:ATP-binding protein [Syntrophomonadaceae bacterium]
TIFSIVAIKNIEHTARYQATSEMMKGHLQMMEFFLQDARMRSHEYARHLCAIQALVELGRAEEAAAYIEGMSDDYQPGTDALYISSSVLSILINNKRELARQQGISFTTAIKGTMFALPVREADLCSMLGNLLDNAVEAASLDEQPEVSIIIDYEGGVFRLEVTNNGQSIDAEDLPHIFEPGFSSREAESRGYGLYIVRHLAEAYGGSITITSGRRTRAILILPDGQGDRNHDS